MPRTYNRKITIRVYDDDVRYLQKHPVEDVQNKRLVPYNEFMREVIHAAVEDLKKMRGH